MRKRASNNTGFLNLLGERCAGGVGNVLSYNVLYNDKPFKYTQIKTNEVKYHLAFLIEPKNYEDRYKVICQTLIDINLAIIFEDFPTSEIPATADCPALSQRNDSNSVVNTRDQNNLVCEKGQKLVKTTRKTSICGEI